MKKLKYIFPGLFWFFAMVLSGCAAQDVYLSTQEWRLEECRKTGNLDERMACEERARSKSPYPDEQEKGSPRDPTY